MLCTATDRLNFAQHQKNCVAFPFVDEDSVQLVAGEIFTDSRPAIGRFLITSVVPEQLG